ncbi:histidine kinase HHK3 [Coniella lustricola]|uniref:histidine kinase n=1 Tax=Coniella lustricola TaxID=2025994 RepID=A0A2T2ZYK8_9PEZI|nr:histidine kinase HHK3 [Coniella lustricola]
MADPLSTLAISSNSQRRAHFFPRADAAILSTAGQTTSIVHPTSVGPVYDPDNADRPVDAWSDDYEHYYPSTVDHYAPAPVPERPKCLADRYLRASLAKNERLRLSMLWYYTRDVLTEGELLRGLQEKAYLAQDSTGWDHVIIGILDVNFFIRLVTIDVPLGILPRGETLCAHTINQPAGNVFLLPDMMEDWRFQQNPYVEHGGLKAYAGVPLRLQSEYGDSVMLGSLCVCSKKAEEPLTKNQQHALARLADWVVSDIVQCTRARRQRTRHHMSDLLARAQREMSSDTPSEEPVVQILNDVYPGAIVSMHVRNESIEIEGLYAISVNELEQGLWEDAEYLDEYVAKSNHKEFPKDRIVRILAAEYESISGPSILTVASPDFRLIFDDIDSWFVDSCANMLSQMWQRSLLSEVLKVKEKFLRGICHQLRTPIHGILGSVDLLAEGLKSTIISGERFVYLDMIKTAGRDLISIVNSVITLNRWADIAVEERHYALHTISELEEELADQIRKMLNGDTRYHASVFFHHDFAAGCHTFKTDLQLLRDSVLPIIINAVQNSPEGVVFVTISSCPGGRELVIDVQDTGRGIDPKHHKLIFEPYEKLSDYSTGAGLGLTLSSKFATLLHGTVTLESSEPDHGSHFRATFSDVQYASSTLDLPQLLASTLQNMPSRFLKLATSPQCEHFATLLACHGFTSAQEIADVGRRDVFFILELLPDEEQHRAQLIQVPADQVAICLIPAFDTQTVERTSKNVIYISGPFLTSTTKTILEEADRLLGTLKLSCDGNDSRAVAAADAEESTKTIETIQVIVENPTDVSSQTKSKITVPLFSTPSAQPVALLVDDNEINLRIMKLYCTKRNLLFLCAVNGQQAIELYTKHQSDAAMGQGSPIQLVLMDLQMPVCDGITATKKIRELERTYGWAQSSLFIITGQDSPADRQAADDAGADEYFVKPVGIKVLDSNVKRYFPAFQTTTQNVTADATVASGQNPTAE